MSMRYPRPWVVLFLGVLTCGLGGPCFAGEGTDLEGLARASGAVPRFNPQEANFELVERTFRWVGWGPKNPDGQAVQTPLSAKRLVLLDRGRMIGFWDGPSFTLMARNPTDDVSSAISPERWSEFVPFGVTLCFGGGNWNQSETRSGLNTISSGKTLGVEWNTADEKDPQSTWRALHRTTVRLDAVFGYVIESVMQWEATSNVVAKMTRSQKGASNIPTLYVMANGVLDPWLEYWPRNFAWLFYEPAADDVPAKGQPFGLIRMNLASWGWNDVPAFRVKPGRLTGFLGRDGTWGIALTTPDGESSQALRPDPEYADYTLFAPLPEKADADGKFRKTVQCRIAQLPPEVGEHILKTGFIRGKGERFFHIRLTGEDFEDQPLPVVQPENGIRYGWGEMPSSLSSAQAHSGKTSLEVKGVAELKGRPGHGNRSWLRMYPGKRYRMECWIKVVGKETEAFVSNHFAGLTTTNQQTIGQYRTPSVREGDWQRVSIEFDPGPCGQAVILGFVCLGPGTAYFDDFSLQAVAADDPQSARGQESGDVRGPAEIVVQSDNQGGVGSWTADRVSWNGGSNTVPWKDGSLAVLAGAGGRITLAADIKVAAIQTRKPGCVVSTGTNSLTVTGGIRGNPAIELTAGQRNFPGWYDAKSPTYRFPGPIPPHLRFTGRAGERLMCDATILHCGGPFIVVESCILDFNGRLDYSSGHFYLWLKNGATFRLGANAFLNNYTGADQWTRELMLRGDPESQAEETFEVDPAFQADQSGFDPENGKHEWRPKGFCQLSLIHATLRTHSTLGIPGMLKKYRDRLVADAEINFMGKSAWVVETQHQVYRGSLRSWSDLTITTHKDLTVMADDQIPNSHFGGRNITKRGKGALDVVCRQFYHGTPAPAVRVEEGTLILRTNPLESQTGEGGVSNVPPAVSVAKEGRLDLRAPVIVVDSLESEGESVLSTGTTLRTRRGCRLGSQSRLCISSTRHASSPVLEVGGALDLGGELVLSSDGKVGAGESVLAKAGGKISGQFAVVTSVVPVEVIVRDGQVLLAIKDSAHDSQPTKKEEGSR